MKPNEGKARLKPDLERTAREAREAIAVVLYDLAQLRTGMASAAAKGHWHYVIPPPGSFDLRSTKAAEAAVAWLKDQGFQVSWDSRRAIDSSARDEAASDLVVSWERVKS